jgi:Protein of Unknown function (DUF2784)
MWYAILADIIVAIHVAYVGFILVGLLAILVGAALRWSWVRNRWFRLAHLLAIAIVAFEALWGITCPLTDWEDTLRSAAGQRVSEGTFIGRCLDSILFYDWPPWAFTSAYVSFALLVLLVLIFVPPRWRGA